MAEDVDLLNNTAVALGAYNQVVNALLTIDARRLGLLSELVKARAVLKEQVEKGGLVMPPDPAALVAIENAVS